MKTTVTQLQPATTFILISFFIVKISSIFLQSKLEVVMRVIRNGTVILLFSFLFFACKKDKEKEYEPILRNGLYFFQTFQTPSVPHGAFYYLYKDDFYPKSLTSDSICFSRRAGYVTKTDSTISIPFLHVFGSNNICIFSNDIYKGKTFIMHLDSLNFNRDLNHPSFSGYYRMFHFLDTINANKIYCTFEWRKD